MDRERIVFIPFPPHFSYPECRWYLDRNYDDCMHTVTDGKVIKAIRVDDQPVLFRISADDMRLRVEIIGGGDGKSRDNGKKVLDHLEAYVRRWFDLEKDLRPFYDLLSRDKKMAYMPGEFRGLRLMGIVDLFEALCWSIIGQQINLRFAFTLKRRLVERYGRSIQHEGAAHYLFPDFETLAEAEIADLRGMQFSESKAKYLTGLAGIFANGELSREILEELPDFESRQKALMKHKGIGIWTANYCLMKTLRDPSCIPYGDTGLLTALANHGIIRERTEREKIDRFFRKYAGWESYMAFYLWRSLYGPLT